MSKHTPGPWEANLDPDRDPGDDVEITAIGATIAAVYGTDQFPCLDPDEDDFSELVVEQVATARLIAAAPDLLAACKAALPSMEKALAIRRSMGLPDKLGGIADALKLIKDAVAKAEGV